MDKQINFCPILRGIYKHALINKETVVHLKNVQVHFHKLIYIIMWHFSFDNGDVGIIKTYLQHQGIDYDQFQWSINSQFCHVASALWREQVQLCFTLSAKSFQTFSELASALGT